MYNSTSRALFSSSISDPSSFVDYFPTGESKRGYYDANISPGGKWIVLNHKGPNAPYTFVMSSSDPSKNKTLRTNTDIENAHLVYNLPKTVVTRLPMKYSQDYKLDFQGINARITYPVGFSNERKHFYPLFVTFYGGPDSQTVTDQFKINILTYMASHWQNGTLPPPLEQALSDRNHSLHKRSGLALDALIHEHLVKRSLPTDMSALEAYRRFTAQPPFVVLEIDGRGTGCRGQPFRFSVTRQMGTVEADDILDSVSQFVKNNDFIDPQKVALWGMF